MNRRANFFRTNLRKGVFDKRCGFFSILVVEAYAFGMGATRPHNPAPLAAAGVRGELRHQRHKVANKRWLIPLQFSDRRLVNVSPRSEKPNADS
jgi:hypothetical protein